MTELRRRLGGATVSSFDALVLLVGTSVLVWAVVRSVTQGAPDLGLALALGVPLVVVVAHFPMVLDGDEGGIEIGFDSAVLMFLICMVEPHVAVTVWSAGVLATQLLSGKRWTARAFNLGVGIIAGALAAVTLTQLRDGQLDTTRELLAVALAAGVYFATDYVVSAVSLAWETGTRVRDRLVQTGLWSAVACFVLFDLLGYLGAVVARNAPWWAVGLLMVPLVTLLGATRAVVRGRENSRRLHVLLDSAIRTQTFYETTQVVDALVADARELLRVREISLRPGPPEKGEIGVQVQRGKEPLWLVAETHDRARATIEQDLQALKALAALSSAAFERLQLTEDMVHYARHDPLTDLPNRGILLDRMTHALHLARRRGGQVALLFVDLDGFKPINDRLGHAAGDTVLVAVARRMVACTRESDTVARLGGDEFAVLLENVDDSVDALADRIVRAVAEGVLIDGRTERVGASIGIAFAEGGDSAETLLRKADLAMYEAKARGKGRFVLYEESIGEGSVARTSLLDALRRAIADGDIDVHYQPVVDIAEDRVVGVEALARWRCEGQDVAPDVFVSLAEETGLVVPLGELVLRRAARDAALLARAGGPGFAVSVNVAADQLRAPGFAEVVGLALADVGEAQLVLEVTERQGIGQDAAVLRTMHEVVGAGARFAIDDFGVGYSTLGYLQEVPAHVVKSDASLARHLDTDPRARAVLRAISLMCRGLGLSLVVEGIERPSQLAVLRDDVGAPYAQGFLLHRPAPLAEVVDLVAADRAGAAPRAAPQLAPTGGG